MKTILVVDDSAEILRIVENALKDSYKLVLVKSGEKALTYLSKNPVHLVLLDIIMPQMDGFEVYEKIRSLEQGIETPVIFLTADMDAASEIRGLKMGAADFIKKPFVPEIMKNRIDKILQLEELKASLQEKVKEKTGQIEQLSVDSLTGLLGRRAGESRVAQRMREKEGCLAFIDLDNLKRTNDTMGHLAGDFALKTVGEVLYSEGEDAVISRIGGDEFLFYMSGVSRDEVTDRISTIMATFDKKREENTYLQVSSLSIGLCMTKPEDLLEDVMKKADRALYHVKQSGKHGYYFYGNVELKEQEEASVDLKKLIFNLKQQGAYDGTLSLEYREFAKVCDYIRHLGERYDYTIQIVMVTVEASEHADLYIEERERVMACMESIIRRSLRSVDVSTRFSSEQFVVILMNVQDEYVEMITNRIRENFHKQYEKKCVSVHFDVENLITEDMAEPV